MNEHQVSEPSRSLAFRPNNEVLVAELGDEISLLNLRTGIYFTLNAIGASIWRQIQQTRTMAQIKGRLLEEYDVEEERCECDLVRIVEELSHHGLIEANPT